MFSEGFASPEGPGGTHFPPYTCVFWVWNLPFFYIPKILYVFAKEFKQHIKQFKMIYFRLKSKVWPNQNPQNNQTCFLLVTLCAAGLLALGLDPRCGNLADHLTVDGTN